MRQRENKLRVAILSAQAMDRQIGAPAPRNQPIVTLANEEAERLARWQREREEQRAEAAEWNQSHGLPVAAAV
jgi:hypothetical protein